MRTLTFFVVVLLFALRLAAQDNAENNFDYFSKVRNGINKQGTHSVHIDYAYATFTDVANQQLVHWRSNGVEAGYFFAITRNINIGIHGVYASSVSKERRGYETDANLTRHYYTYYHTFSSFSILLKGQFFWFNRSPYFGLYSSYALGLFLDKPVINTYLTSGSPHQPPVYYGSSLFLTGEVAGQLTYIGAEFRFSKKSHWYFYGELDLILVVGGGLGYRF